MGGTDTTVHAPSQPCIGRLQATTDKASDILSWLNSMFNLTPALLLHVPSKDVKSTERVKTLAHVIW